MNKPDKDKWVKLDVKFQENYVLLTYLDGHGNKVLETGEDYREVFWDNRTAVRISRDIDRFLTEMLAARPYERNTTGSIKPVPLAIFVDVSLPRSAREMVFNIYNYTTFRYIKSIFYELLNNASFQFVHYLKTKSIPPFKLPYKVWVEEGEATETLDFLKSWEWLESNQFLQDYGIDFQHTTPDLWELKGEKMDILVADIQTNLSYLEEKGIKRPRLIIFKNAFPFDIEIFPFPSDIPVLFYYFHNTKDNYKKFLKDFLYSVIHDYPLHEALAFALSENQMDDHHASLFASPDTNHSLRLIDGLDAFKKTIEGYFNISNPGEPENFLNRLPENAKKSLIKIFNSNPGIQDYQYRIRHNEPFFNRERYGLVPLAYDLYDFNNQQKPPMDDIVEQLKSFVNNDEFYEATRQAQQRVVDASLFEVNDFLQYVAINPNQSLKLGHRYRLNINIGQRSPFSLMSGDVPSIDPLLPSPKDKKGHELEVVLFPKDFIQRSPLRQTIHLPDLGGSDTAQFVIETPNFSDSDLQLRFVIFKDNYLLQAFILEAEMNENGKYNNFPVKVKLDIATSAKFTNIDELGKRSLYIGLNAGSDGSHSLFIKEDKIIKEIHGLNESVINDAQINFSKMLEEAYFEDRQLRFPADTPVDASPGPFFDEIRKFAKFGNEYYSTLFHYNDKDLRQILFSVRDKKNMSFQIARHEINYSFPWPLLYDYPMPPQIAGAEPHPVCMGEALNPAEYPASVCKKGKGCPHNPTLYTYCIEGFWGYRHKIEQLLTSTDASDNIQVINSAKNGLMYASNLTGQYADPLYSSLNATYNVKRICHDEDLLDLLWDKPSRPSSLIVFGHLQEKDVNGEPIGARILTFPKVDWPSTMGDIPVEKWLHHQLLDSKIMTDRYLEGEPLPIVLLISCYNASMQVNSLNSMIKDFHTAGASAIVGTECDITSDFGAKFIREIVHSLYEDEMELGDAIQAFNQGCFANHNPLPFVFTCFGNSNLKIIK